MASITRWLYVACAVSLVCSALAIVEVARLSRRLKSVITTDTLAVPSGTEMFSSGTAGIAPSESGDAIVLWLRRLDTNAGTHLEVRKDGTESLDFFDRRGRLRLRIGLDAAGRGVIQMLDESGKAQSISPAN
jgi:hypothetical protein